MLQERRPKKGHVAGQNETEQGRRGKRSPTASTGTTSRLIANPPGTLLIAALLLFSSVLTAAQLPSVPASGNQGDLELQGLVVADPLIVGEHNLIKATVENRGDIPVNATVVAFAKNSAGDSRGPRGLSVTIPGKDSVEVRFPPLFGQAVAELTGPVDVRVQAYVTPEEFIEDTLGFLQINENPLSGSWTDLWDDNIDSVKQTLEAALFSESETKDAEAAWNQLWGEGVAPQREVIESVLLDEDFDRIDPDPSNNAMEVERTIIQHGIKATVDASALPTALDVENQETVTIIVNIENQGDEANHLSIGLTEVTPQWQFRLADISERELTLPPGQSKGIEITIQGPVDAAAGTSGTAKLSINSRTAPLTGGAVPGLSSPPALGYGTLLASLQPASGAVEATEALRTISYTLSVKNIQNQVVDINPQPVEPTASWVGWNGAMSIDPESAVDVGQDQSVEFDVTVSVPSNAPAGDQRFGASLFWDPMETDAEPLQAPNFTLTVPQWHKVAFNLGASLSSVEPGGLTPVVFDVQNLGNGRDNFTIFLSDAPAGWRIVNSTAEVPEPFEVFGFDDEMTAGLFLEIPANAEPGPESIQFRIDSVQGEAMDTLTHTVSVPERVFPQIVIPDEFLDCHWLGCPLSEDATTLIPITVRNGGNVEGGMELDFQVDFDDALHDDWVVSFDSDSFDPESFSLAPGESDVVILNVTSPDTTSGGLDPSDFGAVTLGLVATMGGEYGGKESTEIIGFAAAFPDLGIDNVTAIPDGLSEEEEDPPLYLNLPADLVVVVKNYGTEQAAGFDVKVTFKAGTTTVATPTVATGALEVGALRAVHVPIPTDAGYGNLEATVELDPQDKIEEYRNQDGAESNVDPPVPLEFRFFDFAVTPQNDRTADPGEAISLEDDLGFLVENAGADAENVTVTLVSDPPLTQDSWSGQKFVPEEQEEYGTNFHIPSRPTAIETLITLRVSHGVHASLYEESTFTIRVNDTLPPVIHAASPVMEEIALGSPLNVSADIWDLTGVESAKVVILEPTGVARHVPMDVDPSSGDHYVVVTFATPGTHEFYIWANDATPERYENDTAATKFSIEVLPESRPGLRLLTPASGQAIRPGDDVVVSAFNVTGLRSASARVFGESMTLPAINPLVLPTESWPDGTASVDVTVVDSFGTSKTETFSVFIDGTPPDIKVAGLDTSADKVTVTVTVTDNDAVDSVKLRVDPGGNGQSSDVPMSQNGDRFTASITDLDGKPSLTVIATDQAGNTASKQIADGGAAGGPGAGALERFTPGLGAAWMILCMLVLAILKCPRRPATKGGDRN